LKGWLNIFAIAALFAGAYAETGHAAAQHPVTHHKRHAKPAVHPKPKPASSGPVIETGPRIPDRLLRFAGSQTSLRKFRAGAYMYPQGWFFHRWTFGERLPQPFYVSRYWIAEYGQLGLMEPPHGYVWVRVDTDALLVHMDSGEVLRSVYNVFY
jgi:Ni/Co efflux regulator RcnB